MKQPTTYGLPNKKEKVIEQLNLAYSEQNLEEEEFERRLKEAVNAQSIEELKLVIFDFPISIKESIFPENKVVPTQNPSPTLPTTIPQNKIQTILGEDKRNIPLLSQRMPKFSTIMGEQKLDFRLSQIAGDTIYLHFEAILSSVKIDLRNEYLGGKTLNIHVTGSFGEVRILLPRGGNIQKNIQSVAGSVSIQDKNRSWIRRFTGLGKSSNQELETFTVNLTGIYWFGEVKLIY